MSWIFLTAHAAPIPYPCSNHTMISWGLAEGLSKVVHIGTENILYIEDEKNSDFYWVQIQTPSMQGYQAKEAIVLRTSLLVRGSRAAQGNGTL